MKKKVIKYSDIAIYWLEIKSLLLNLSLIKGNILINDRCETLIQLLKVKLNHLSKDTEKMIYQSNMDKLNQLTIKIFQVNNEEDVKTILEN